MKNPFLPETACLRRRDFLYGLGASLGSVAFSDLLAREAKKPGPLALKKPHHAPKAKAVIMLFMEGGPSHIDTFDPKPRLQDLHMKGFVNDDEKVAGSGLSGDRFYVKSPYKFRKTGQSGIDMCEHFIHMAKPEVADELCVYKGCQAFSVNHPFALYHMNTGNPFGGDPAVGAWTNYGLGSENQDLPGFVVLTELAYPQGGAGNWSNGFLPGFYQGTPLRAEGSPILDLKPPAWKSREHQRKNLDLLSFLNQKHAAGHPHNENLAARMENYELAYRMQMKVPGIIDVDREPKHVKDMYGLDSEETDSFGRKCLLARRLIEKGVRFVQIFSGGWDSHDYIERAHKKRIYSIDRPIAGLIRDLKARDMLKDTLIVWCGEFGRTPDNTKRGGVTALGRDHNANAMAMWFAGGGVKQGAVVGSTDEIGERAVEVVHPIKDMHVTLLRLFGLDDNKLTYFHGGRFKQLSQTGGQVIKELIA